MISSKTIRKQKNMEIRSSFAARTCLPSVCVSPLCVVHVGGVVKTMALAICASVLLPVRGASQGRCVRDAGVILAVPSPTVCSRQAP